MGAGMGLRLVEGGATVLTDLEGRGDASRRRAAEAGMEDAPLGRIAGADLVLSIVPPGVAVEVAERLAPALRASTPAPHPRKWCGAGVVVDGQRSLASTAARSVRARPTRRTSP